VSFELEPVGSDVLLTLTHRQLPDRNMSLMVSAGWHAHCDVLTARMTGARVDSFWTHWLHLRAEYDRRIPV
jgi:hypothetical protein